MGEAGKSKEYIPFESLGDMLDSYRQSLEARNRSHKTISWYLDILKRFFTFLELNGQLKPLCQMGKKELESYVLYLQQAIKWPNSNFSKTTKCYLSPFSIQGHVRAVKAFWSWLCEEGYIVENHLVKFPLPKVPKNIVKTLTLEQIKKLLNEVDKHNPLGARYHCILLLLLDTGARISELVGIKITDIDYVHGLVKVMGKGQKERIVPFHKLTRKELLRYINQFRLSLCPQESPYLFANDCGDHISVASVQQYIRRLAKRAELDGVKCSPHVFRHTFATHAITAGADVFTVKDIMGHSSLATTMKYTHLSVDDLKTQHNKFSPVGSLMKDKP